MNFWETLGIAAIPAIITALIAYLRNRVEYERFRTENMPISTVKKYLEHEKYPDRKFTTIQKHIGGYDEDPNELRRILVKAGAERTYGKVDGEEIEYWNLMSRRKEKDKKRKNEK